MLEDILTVIGLGASAVVWFLWFRFLDKRRPPYKGNPIYEEVKRKDAERGKRILKMIRGK